MGKDREGNYHPPKGKPSGSGREEGVGLNQPFTGSFEQYEELADKYTEGADELPAGTMRHPNRNVNKSEERKDARRQKRNSYKSRTETVKEDFTPTESVELPGILTKEMFADLANYKAETCVSLYIPTHKAGVEVNEQLDIINFKNGLQDVANALKQRGLDQASIQRILEPGHELVKNTIFWRYMERGLAVFMADGFFRYAKLPSTPPQKLIMNSGFYLMPLVPVMTVKEYFYLLVISKKQAKFFKVDAFGLQPIQIDELPNGVDDVVHFEEKDDQKLFRTETAHGGRGANFHGHGAGKPDEKEHIALYLEEVDDTLWQEVLHNENVPLVLAGVEYLLPIYRSVSDYNFVYEKGLTGNYEHVDYTTLFDKARELMEPYFRERTMKALETYANQSATALTSSIPADVIPAAHYGRVAHIFVLHNQHIWGTFDEMENKLVMHEERQEDDEPLLDRTVIKTILNGGDVHILDEADMPAQSKVAALLRY